MLALTAFRKVAIEANGCVQPDATEFTSAEFRCPPRNATADIPPFLRRRRRRERVFCLGFSGWMVKLP